MVSSRAGGAGGAGARSRAAEAGARAPARPPGPALLGLPLERVDPLQRREALREPRGHLLKASL